MSFCHSHSPAENKFPFHWMLSKRAADSQPKTHTHTAHRRTNTSILFSGSMSAAQSTLKTYLLQFSSIMCAWLLLISLSPSSASSIHRFLAQEVCLSNCGWRCVKWKMDRFWPEQILLASHFCCCCCCRWCSSYHHHCSQRWGYTYASEYVMTQSINWNWFSYIQIDDSTRPRIVRVHRLRYETILICIESRNRKKKK